LPLTVTEVSGRVGRFAIAACRSRIRIKIASAEIAVKTLIQIRVLITPFNDFIEVVTTYDDFRGYIDAGNSVGESPASIDRSGARFSLGE
jgi:hypothetical protein